jgi:hypothetical protein
MLKKLLVVTAVAVLQAVSFSAGAVTFDFVAEAAGNEHGAASIIVNDVSGLSVTATGFDTSTGAAYFAYLDDLSGGPGGLGVCQNLSVDQCDPSSDDNVTFGESLKLVFNQEVTIDQITFNNGDHKQIFSGDFDLTINGGSTVTYALTNIFNMPLTGTEFIFSNPNTLGGSDVSNEYQFYIGALEVTPVPLPAAVWLFGCGLFGLVAVARRRV